VARIPDTFNFRSQTNIKMQELLELLDRMYIDLAEAVNSKPDLYQRSGDGQATDTFLAQGSININTSTNKVEMLTNHVNTTTVTWTTLS
jgi:hypothetical protein